MLAVGRSRLAASGSSTLPKLNALLANALARAGPLSTAALTTATKSSATPFVKANLPLFTSILLRNYATAAKKKTTATKKKTTATKKKTTAAKKKPAAKRRTVAKKTTTRRPAAKKKVVKKKPVVKKKKVVKKTEKKPGLVSNLKATLRDAPKRRVTAYNLFYTDFFRSSAGGTAPEIGKAAGAQWRTLSEAEKKVWVDRATQETIKKNAEYEKWLANLNPADIVAANVARQRVRSYRLAKGRKNAKSIPPIKDARLVKRRVNAWSFFVKDNYNNPEVLAVGRDGRLKKLAQLFKAISPAEKKKYDDLSARDKTRYETEKAEFEKKYVKSKN